MSQRSRNYLILIVLLVCVAAAIFYYLRQANAQDGGSREAAAVPVVVGLAQVADVPHLLHAVGTVEPLQQVEIRAQVEGVLTSVLFEEGELVEQGQLLATIDDRVLQATLSSARAELASNESQLRNARNDLTRYRNLAERNAIARQTLDQQEALVEQLQADINRNKASIEDAQVRLSYTQITSPVTGRVGIRRVDAGNLVRPGDASPIVTVTQMHPISVLFAVPQASFAAVRSAAAANQAQVQVIDRDSGRELASGPISAIDNSIRSATGTVQVRARFDNEDEALWPGQFIAVRVPVGFSNDVVIVPSIAIRLGMDSPYVYVLEDDDTVRMAPVSVGYRDEDSRTTVITKGVQPGDAVVVDGFIRLSPGTKVKAQSAQASAMSQHDNTASGDTGNEQ